MKHKRKIVVLSLYQKYNLDNAYMYMNPAYLKSTLFHYNTKIFKITLTNMLRGDLHVLCLFQQPLPFVRQKKGKRWKKMKGRNLF